MISIICIIPSGRPSENFGMIPEDCNYTKPMLMNGLTGTSITTTVNS